MKVAVSAIIATKDRAQILLRTIRTLADQSWLPAELIIIDASEGDQTRLLCEEGLNGFDFKTIYLEATEKGAAIQRMQGIKVATQSIIWFLDDDIILERDCARKLLEGFSYQEKVGAVNAMITNQRYTKPGRVTRFMYRLMHGLTLPSYAGKIIGPAWNLLPEDEPGLPEYVRCEWLNTTCTMYKRDAMPDPVFPDFFEGYSLMEDVVLSVNIRKTHTLLNARTARIFHDSQAGTHKDNVRTVSAMQLINRHYVMSKVLHRNSFSDYSKLLLLELFGLITSLRSSIGWKNFVPSLIGKLQATYSIIFSK